MKILMNIFNNIKTNYKSYSRSFKLSWQSGKLETILLIICSIIKNAYWPLRFWVTKFIIDTVTLSRQLGLSHEIKMKLFFEFIILFILFFSNRIWWPINSLVQTLSSMKLSNKLKIDMMQTISNKNLEFYDFKESYDKFENALKEVEGKRPINVVNNVINFIAQSISFLIMFIPVFFYNPLLSLILFLSSLPGYLIQKRFSIKNYELETNNAENRRKMKYLSDLFVTKQSSKEIRIYGILAYLLDLYNKVHSEYYIKLKNLVINKFKAESFAMVMTSSIGAIVYFIISVSASKNSISIGDYSLLVAAISTITGGINTLSTTINNIDESNKFLDNLLEFLSLREYQPDKNKQQHNISNTRQHTIEFKNVSFKYPDSKNYALKNVSFKISTPQKVALVGLNGAGKSTLIKLITKLYIPSEGCILLDGENINKYDEDKLRSLFSVCFQDFFNYGFRAFECIGIGNLAFVNDIDKIKESASKSGIDTIIDKFDNKYNTYLSKEFCEEGIELSGGLAHKVALARTFMRGDNIIILDEPTAALDAISEEEIYMKFNEITKGCLSIIVTHRLSSTINADKILVLEKGSLVEMGTHKSLIDINGIYSKLFNLQASKYIS